jgi:putative flavoprotein involved in K+ transport
VAAAEARLRRLLGQIDQHIDANGLHHEVLEPQRTRPHAPTRPVSDLDVRAAGIRILVWATGHRRSYPWLRLPEVLDHHGEIRQHRGHTPIPGLYVLGQRFQHRRGSHLIGGVGRDAAAVAEHIVGRHRVANTGTAGHRPCVRSAAAPDDASIAVASTKTRGKPPSSGEETCEWATAASPPMTW